MILFEDFFQLLPDMAGEGWPIAANRIYAHSLPRKCDERLRQRWAAGARTGWRHTGGGGGSICDPGRAKRMWKVHAVKPRWWYGFCFNGRSENRWDLHCGLGGCPAKRWASYFSLFNCCTHFRFLRTWSCRCCWQVEAMPATPLANDWHGWNSRVQAAGWRINYLAGRCSGGAWSGGGGICAR